MALSAIGSLCFLLRAILGPSLPDRVMAVDGFVVRPASLLNDLEPFVAAVVPVLQGAGYLRESYPGTTLRDTLGLRPRTARAAVGV